MEAEVRDLTARQREYFEHVRQAREQGLTLTAYCRAQGLEVRSLYGVRRELVRKGRLPRTLAPKTKRVGPSPFVAVQVASGASVAEPVCRVRHPSGWVVECGAWPEAGWVSSLMQGGGDATA